MLNPSTIVPSYHPSRSPSHRFAEGARVPLLERTRLPSPPLSSTPTFRVPLRAPSLSSPIVSSVSLPRRPSSPGPPFPGISTPFSPGGVVPPRLSLSVSLPRGDGVFWVRWLVRWVDVSYVGLVSLLLHPMEKERRKVGKEGKWVRNENEKENETSGVPTRANETPQPPPSNDDVVRTWSREGCARARARGPWMGRRTRDAWCGPPREEA